MAHLLIVDDDPLICESLALTLEGMGHTTRCARTVREAVEKVGAESFDIAFCDD